MRIVSAIYNEFSHLDTEYECDTVVTRSGDDLKEGDILVLHGGEDISPHYYKEKPSKYTNAPEFPSARDHIEFSLAARAVELGIPILGICRGAQLLCILAGGKLFQHVVGHDNGDHTLHILKEDRLIWANSFHHQQMDLRGIKKDEYELLATHPYKGTARYKSHLGTIDYSLHEDPEIVWFPKVKGFAVQSHPEWMPITSKLVQYTLTKSRELWELS